MKTVFRYLRPHLAWMAVGLSVKFLGAMMDLLLPWILAQIIDTVVPQKSVRLIVLWGGAMVACSLLAMLFNITANRVAAKVAQRTTGALRQDLFVKISYLSCAQVDSFTIPSLEARLTSDTYNLHHLIGSMQRIGVRAPILLLGGIAITLSLEPVLALILLAMLPLCGAVVFTVTRVGVPLYTRFQRALDSMVQVVRENISGVRVIKALSKTDYEQARFSAINKQVSDSEQKAGVAMAKTSPLMHLLLNFGLVFVVAAGAWRVNAGLSQPGIIIAFMSYFTIILQAMMSISRIFANLTKGSASAARIAEVLASPEELAPIARPARAKTAHVVFEDVSFSYQKKEETLSQIHFSLARGQTLGIIGATGCGKSTILRLLLRFYEADSGEIRISGRPIVSLTSEELHEKFGVVFQDDVLLGESILENIRFGRKLSLAQVQHAARLALASEFIAALPEGYEHVLAPRGSNLSGGQKQRLLLARALAGSPEILLLDDASSALDYRTDALLRRALRENFANTTTIIVAQRISSILGADLILVMDEGKIIDRGTHEELLKHCEIYREISRLQMGGEDVA